MKVVINACFGGFRLSPKAVMLYAKYKNMTIYAYVKARKEDGSIDFSRMVPFKENERAFFVHYGKVPLVDGKIPEESYFSDRRDIPRNDPDLIRVVEELGTEANGDCATLKIVEIPDSIEWEISEHDGNETVIDAPVLVPATDAHYSASVLIAEITDLRAQLAGEKATNARLQGLLNQATVNATDWQKNHCDVYTLWNARQG